MTTLIGNNRRQKEEINENSVRIGPIGLSEERNYSNYCLVTKNTNNKHQAFLYELLR